jgi:hypothetical protein
VTAAPAIAVVDTESKLSGAFKQSANKNSLHSNLLKAFLLGTLS